MNVLMVVAWDNLGGVSAVVNNAALHLQENGHNVQFLFPEAPAADAPRRTRLGFPAHYLYLRPTSSSENAVRTRVAFLLGFPSTIRALQKLVRELHIDVVNVHFPGTWSVHLAALRKLGSAKLVTSIHGADVLLNGTRDHVPHAGLNMLLGASDMVVVPSKGFQNAVAAAWPKLAHASVEVIPNGIDPAELGYDPETSETASVPPYVMSILAMVPYKGADILIRAFADVALSHPDYRLKLIGDGPHRAEYEALAKTLGIGSRVEFLGLQDRKSVAKHLRGSSLFVLPSRTNSESFGIAVAEAMALNRAVIGSNIGGLPELIEHGVTGLLVPQGDVTALAGAMRDLIGDAAMRTQLGNAAGARVRSERLWRNTGARYLQLMKKLTSG